MTTTEIYINQKDNQLIAAINQLLSSIAVIKWQQLTMSIDNQLTFLKYQLYIY